MTRDSYQIAVIRGDGIGPELIDSALAVLDRVSVMLSAPVVTTFLDAGADTYRRCGTAMSTEAVDVVRRSDATLKGPVGLPEVRRPDGTEAGLLGGVLRSGLDLYANVRPIRLFPGAPTRLRAEPGKIDYVIVRENTEGLYASRGKGVGNDQAMADTLLITRRGTERIVRRAFEIARRHAGAPLDGVRRVTCVDKANVLKSMFFFRSVFEEVAGQYPDIEHGFLHVDAAAQALVMEPERFDVMVTENMLGDILSDLGGGTVGGVAFCPGGNFGDACAYFEPIHGSAPSLAGLDRANPVSEILAVAMMLDHLGEVSAAQSIQSAVASALADGSVRIAVDGTAVDGTRHVTDTLLDHLA